MENHAQLIKRFYEAFRNKDYVTMQQCYHPEATFHDPVFQNLNVNEVRAMWEMLLRASADLQISFKDIKTGDNTGHCHWEAVYNFSLTGRQVHNVIEASFLFRDNKIVSHKDTFSLYRWSRQAFGTKGILLGWTSLMQNKIRKQARGRLDKFMSRVATP